MQAWRLGHVSIRGIVAPKAGPGKSDG